MADCKKKPINLVSRPDPELWLDGPWIDIEGHRHILIYGFTEKPSVVFIGKDTTSVNVLDLLKEQ